MGLARPPASASPEKNPTIHRRQFGGTVHSAQRGKERSISDPGLGVMVVSTVSTRVVTWRPWPDAVALRMKPRSGRNASNHWPGECGAWERLAELEQSMAGATSSIGHTDTVDRVKGTPFATSGLRRAVEQPPAGLRRGRVWLSLTCRGGTFDQGEAYTASPEVAAH